MAASVSGRSRVGSRSARSSRSKATTRQRTTPREDEPAATKPDLEELRRRRILYLSASPDARRKLATSSVKKALPNETGPTKAQSKSKSTSGEHRRRRRKHRSSSSKSEEEKPERPARNRTEEYVYGIQNVPPERDDHNPERSNSRVKRRSTKSSSSRRDSLPTVLESEVTPDDSISQVGLRPAKESSSSLSTSRSLRRSHTSSRLQPISESTKATSVKSSKRDSTHSLLGSMFRRNTAPPVPTAPRLVECLTCGSDDVPHAHAAKLACGHRMCHECLRRVFEMSVKDPAHMPPRCCTDEHIPLKHVDRLFDLKFKMLWNRKYQEYHTKNKIYCPAPKCGEWIKPSHIHTSHGRKYAQCPRCSTKVCTSCNSKLHKSRDCPKDPEIAKLVEQAKEEGWKRCYNCNAMVELKEGCNHMTCRCLAEFCMVCSKKWKTCDCPWFNYMQTPDADRLNEWRIPEPIQVIYRRAFGAPEPEQRPADAGNERPADHRRQRTYLEELEHRRRQERSDADLARRMQLATLFEGDEEPRRRRQENVETWGLGNAAGHFMNDNFVQNAANVVMSAFGDAAMGRRGDRSSGRRRRARESRQDPGDAGLAPNFLGDESVLGAPASNDRARAPS